MLSRAMIAASPYGLARRGVVRRVDAARSRHRIHLYFYHSPSPSSLLEVRGQRGSEQSRKLDGSLDHELPARGLRARGARLRSGIDRQPADAVQRSCAIVDERLRIAVGARSHGDDADPPKRRISQLRSELKLGLVEARPRVGL